MHKCTTRTYEYVLVFVRKFLNTYRYRYAIDQFCFCIGHYLESAVLPLYRVDCTETFWSRLHRHYLESAVSGAVLWSRSNFDPALAPGLATGSGSGSVSGKKNCYTNLKKKIQF